MLCAVSLSTLPPVVFAAIGLAWEPLAVDLELQMVVAGFVVALHGW